ncbi:CG10326 [Drosophila busckii]|uniref:Reticulon-like protein n=1 Tax=Drosophila busckii TaxID=30019 RepID=A0A0M4ED46_DROBS|nr:ARL-6-interacting protein 1 homolog [Drosophila busckii]ALC45666.1 CG10326 [Drosophila busckii]
MTTPQVDQKRALNKLKHDLEPLRNAIVGVYDLLTWEKQYYAGIVFAAISINYLILWYMDLSCITLFSLLALSAFFGDFALPTLSRLLASGNKWEGEQEAKFEEVCGQLCSIRARATQWYEYLLNERKPTMVVVAISVTLLVVAWIGAIINNLLLMYFATIVVLMWPGLQEKDVFKSLTQKASKIVNEKLQYGKKKLQ